ncbi:uncharacterized protein LOC133173503 [Saccostrea echinata]|uniref:uncharacterized protein LOC133173503 n=1 Tax=Saccostrea echinata TaxID=191078 RepID=UPI002A7EABCE|nr:uncharacterized protein LOC133173503 [Saccostrea echinata]
MASHSLLQVESGIQRLSESVFAGLCRKVGTPTQVTIRREVQDIKEVLSNHVTTVDGCSMMWSGSYRDGFRLQGSDVDVMFSLKNFQVVWDLDQAQTCNTNRKDFILCDCSESPPGFTLLEFMITDGIDFKPIYIRIKDKLYISSSKVRRYACSPLPPNWTQHGPCGSGYLGKTEYDYAVCYRCKLWPPSASSWVDRCHSWPQPQVVHDIVRNGCHFVPIGHKLGNHEDHEWRISFSQAEQKLVYSMNHCQFLTYGLLKIFLKETINGGYDAQNKVLCSYHMKTAVFWAIQQNTILEWNPQTLLEGFWVCFKLLLKWVYEGICPNFFIPENNIFLNNIHGEAQKLLFCRLYGLYEKGLVCLLHSPSIRLYVINVLYNPRQSICTHEYNLITEAELDVELFNETYTSDVLVLSDLPYFIKNVHTIENLMSSPLTKYQVILLQRPTTSSLQTTAFLFFNKCTHTRANKLMYTADKMICYMLRLAAKFGCISDMLYIAMYYYQTYRYTKSLSIIEITKDKLANAHVTYHNRVDPERYSEAVGGQSLSAKLRQARADDIHLYPKICYIKELTPEQSVLEEGDTLNIPTFVLLYMLEILCSIHTDTIRAQRALLDLQALVHSHQGVFVPEGLKDISWQILGICQQITGNIKSALFSYQQSIRHIYKNSLHQIQTATLMRIQDIMRTIQHESI